MTFWILLAIAGFLTLMSLRYRNILMSLGASLGWIALWMYNLNYPPTNIVIGSTLHEVLVYTFIIMAIAVMLMYFWNRNRGFTGYPTTKREEAALEAQSRRPRGIMDLSSEQYKTYIHSRIRRRR